MQQWPVDKQSAATDDAGDVPADEQRALENLKDRTGLFILSASASGQAAREYRPFNQGLLTYGLLSGINWAEVLQTISLLM